MCTQGLKDDEDKPSLDLLLDFSEALLEIGKLSTFGANKYAPGNWKFVTDGKSRYTAAMLRHLFKEKKEIIDPETNLLHATATAWNALARLQLLLEDKEK